METRTFILGNRLALTVLATAVKSLDVQPASKGGYAGHVTFNSGVMGLVRAQVDATKVLGDLKNPDLDDVLRWLTQAIFCSDNPIPILSLTRLALGGGDAGSDRPTPGLGMDLK